MAMMKIILIVLLSVLPIILGNEFDLCNATLSNETGDYRMRTLTKIPNPKHPNNRSLDFELRCFGVDTANDATRHSALKLEKSIISKVQKHIFCHFKNGKKSIFAPEKSLKLPKMQFSDFFLVQKLIFCHF